MVIKNSTFENGMVSPKYVATGEYVGVPREVIEREEKFAEEVDKLVNRGEGVTISEGKAPNFEEEMKRAKAMSEYLKSKGYI